MNDDAPGPDDRSRPEGGLVPPVFGRDTHVVPEGVEGPRLDRYAAQVLERIPSVSNAYKSAKRGLLRVDGQPSSPDTRLRPGHRIELWGGGRRPPPVFPLELNVLYEDAWLAVVEKPPGYPTSGNKHRTLENALPHNLSPPSPRDPLPDALPRPRPAHRLDVRTRGLVLVGRTGGALAALGLQFEHRRVHKRYRALLTGRLEGEGTVEEPVDDRPARTRYRAVSHTRSLKPGWVTTVDLWPETGRTHQLRRHVSSLGHPVLGDDLYGLEGLILRRQGLFLCAVEIRFQHPHTGEDLCFEIPEPHKFHSHRRREARRWHRHRGQRESDEEAPVR